MAKGGFKRGVVDRFEKDLNAYVDVADDFVAFDNKDKLVVRGLTESARSGKGPGDKPYIPYKRDKDGGISAYEKKKKSAGGTRGRWMSGLDASKTHMLALFHFVWKKIGKNKVQLTWTGTGGTEVYGRVHNDGLGGMAKRRWMHLTAKLTKKRINERIEGILINHKKIWDAKHGRR